MGQSSSSRSPVSGSAATAQLSSPGEPSMRACRIVGGGIAGLASAAYLIQKGGIAGDRIRVLEQSQPGGSLDAAGSPQLGYSMRGSRMFGPAYVLSYELFDSIPSLQDPAKSITQDTFEFWQDRPWYDKARLVDHGRIVDVSSWGLRNRERADLVKLMVQDEDHVEGLRIDECFEPHLFESNFWRMWASMFGFETWHSAAELRRYLLRFLRLFPDLETMQIIQSTRYCGHDSIVRPLVRWLEQQGVRFDTGVQVTDLVFGPRDGCKRVCNLHVLRGGQAEAIDVAPEDITIVTLGSMTAGSSLGSMDAAPVPRDDTERGSWALWKKLAAKDPAFGRPWVFCGQPEQTRWITFTVTDDAPGFLQFVERFSDRPAGEGGLVTLTSSPWMLTFHLYPSPAYAGQPADRYVWWGYGLLPDRPGEFVAKPMPECSGREILVELYSHLGLHDDLETLLAHAQCIPCLLPYTTSQFMPRSRGDRPPVVPEGYEGLAVVGQYCEIPHDVVYTVEYSVHSALLAVSGLLGLDEESTPPTYVGLDHPNALVEALRKILR
jgi:oleate hydratase